MARVSVQQKRFSVLQKVYDEGFTTEASLKKINWEKIIAGKKFDMDECHIILEAQSASKKDKLFEFIFSKDDAWNDDSSDIESNDE